MSLDMGQLKKQIDQKWNELIIPALFDYIRIPNVSPSFDKEWQKNGHIDKAVELAVDWCRQQDIKGMEISVERLENRSPLIFIQVAGTETANEHTVLLYGHLDKQPEMAGWDQDKGPWKPVLQDDKLFGRGAADDGYAIFTAITAIKALQEQGIPHSRCVLIIESCEEGGSHDLPFYIATLDDRIGTPDLIICLDSGCGNYDQLWLTTSLRGVVVSNLTVELLKEGIHSGNGGGAVASSFRVLRILLDRLEEAKTGLIAIEESQTEIPEPRKRQAKTAASFLGTALFKSFPTLEETELVVDDPYELILNRTWRPSLSYIGADGFPKPDVAGNVLRPKSTIKLSLRLPPTADSKTVAEKMKGLLESSPPYRANVLLDILDYADGWDSPTISPWLDKALNESSQMFFGKGPAFMGEGGSIPFMNLLSTKFPGAQFVVTGVLGPFSNAHGPNEFLHIPTVKKINGCIAHILALHGSRPRE